MITVHETEDVKKHLPAGAVREWVEPSRVRTHTAAAWHLKI